MATANDISRLPPEMVRKRFLDPTRFELEALARASEGFPGSAIEQAIVSAMYTAHAQGRAPSQADLLAEIQQSRPLSVLLAEKVEEIREWASERTVPCD